MMKVPTPGKFCIFVGDLQPHCTEYDLQQLCGQYGTLVNVLIKRNAATPYAFVTFTSTESAESAIHYLHGYQFMGRTLKYIINISATALLHSPLN
ncbi:RNA-binding protein [archaeon]|nr:MAG: RNA-binding protein [archaeon]